MKKTHKFRVGDKVVMKDNKTMMYYIPDGTVGVVTAVQPQANGKHLAEVLFENGHSCSIYERRIDFAKENKMFDVRNESWFIRVKSAAEFYAAEDWLRKNFGSRLGLTYTNSMVCLTNTKMDGQVTPTVMYSSNVDSIADNCKEIVLSLEAVVKEIICPKESQAQKTLKELQKQIEELQSKAQELQKQISK
jgi:hypothetical protein